MTRYKIVPIVEGEGEVESVPILMNRWFKFRRFENFGTPPRAVRAHRGSLTCEFEPNARRGIEYYVLEAAAARPDGILVILDADDECIQRRGRAAAQQLGPELLQRARSAAGHIPLGVVVANREFEAWYLAGYRRLKGLGHFAEDTRFPASYDVEGPRDCKGLVSRYIGRRYSPPADQKVLARAISFKPYMGKYSRSFRKLLTDLERIAREARRARRARARA